VVDDPTKGKPIQPPLPKGIELDNEGRVVINLPDLAAMVSDESGTQEETMSTPNGVCPQINLTKGCGSRIM
jgi:hypothetical protein